ncbi:MAG: hypothetical protein GY884_19485 [Proteobacteria bacterium]|nr:hypothetical protein [Pseudomonadota bacterium]
MKRRLLYAVIPLVILFVGAELVTRALRTSKFVQRTRPAVVEGPHLLALGDSWTYGYGVEPEEAWPGKLAQDTGWTVVNLGEPGSHPLVTLARFRSWPHTPSTVIVLTGANPVDTAGAPKAGAPKPNPLQTLALFRVVEQIVARQVQDDDMPAERRGLSKAPIRETLLQLRRMTSDQGAGLLVLTYPLPADSDAEIAQVNSWIRGVCASNEIPVLALEKVNQDLGRDALLYDKGLDLHPSAPGYSRMAEAIAEQLSPARTD